MVIDKQDAVESATVRVAAVQMEPRLGDVAFNRASIVRKLREAAQAGARLVVFPEGALSGYGFGSKAEALEHAESIPGPAVSQVAAACAELGQMYAVFGMLEKN